VLVLRHPVNRSAPISGHSSESARRLAIGTGRRSRQARAALPSCRCQDHSTATTFAWFLRVPNSREWHPKSRYDSQARELARLAEEENWAGEVYVYENQDEIDRALGTGRDEYGLLSIWWD
jgi:hypothetical protein